MFIAQHVSDYEDAVGIEIMKAMLMMNVSC